jgi:hypothetical protein
MLEQREVNQEFLARNPQLGVGVRRTQRDEMLATHRYLGAQQAEVDLGAQLGDELDPDQRQQLGEVLGAQGVDLLADMSQEVFTDRERRNAALTAQFRQTLQQRAAAGDAGAQAVLDHFDDPEELDRYLTGMAENLYAGLDQYSRENQRATLQDLYTVHNADLLQQAERQATAARVRTMQQEAMAPLGGRSALRRAMQAVMEVEPEDENVLMDVFTKTLGVRGEDIGRTIGEDQLQELRGLHQEFQEAARTLEGADTPEERRRAMELLQARADAFRTAMEKTEGQLRRSGFYFNTILKPEAVDRQLRYHDYVDQLLEQVRDDEVDLRVLDRDQRDEVRELAEAADVEVAELLRADEDDFEDMALTDDQRQRAVRLRQDYREEEDRRIEHEQQRTRDILAQFYTDQVTMERLGAAGLRRAETLSDLQDELYERAEEEGMTVAELLRSGDQRALEIREEQEKQLQWFSENLAGGETDYAYLGADKEQLQEIGERLAGSRDLPTGSMEDVLSLTEAEISRLVDTETISEEEAASIREAKQHRDTFRERARDRAREYATRGRDIAESFIHEVTGLSEAEVEELLTTEEGAETLSKLQVGGESGARMRAHLEEAQEAIQAYHEGTLSAAERRRVEAEYGDLLDIHVDDGMESPERILDYLNETHARFSEEIEDDKGTRPLRIEIAELVVHRDGSADLTSDDSGEGEMGGAG